jgi:hypothetical protein
MSNFTKTQTDRRKLVQINLNLNQPADRFLHDALTASPLGAISAGKLAKHILVEWAQQHYSHLNMADYTEQATERKERKRAPRQSKKSAASASSVSMPDFIQKPASENQVYNDVLESSLSTESEPRPVIRVSHNFR